TGMTPPFTYPHVWRHGPRGYADYPSYRPWRRDEFTFCCVYCLLREWWVLGGLFIGAHRLMKGLLRELLVLAELVDDAGDRGAVQRTHGHGHHARSASRTRHRADSGEPAEAPRIVPRAPA